MGTAFPPRMAVLSLFSGVSPKFRPPELSHLPVDNFNDFGYNQIRRNRILSGGMPGDARSDTQ